MLDTSLQKIVTFSVHRNGRHVGTAVDTMKKAFEWVDDGYQVVISDD